VREKQVVSGSLGLAREISLAAEAQLVVVYGKVPVDFELDLVCPSLKHMDVIFGMDWMLAFGVNINCLTKRITFFKPVAEVNVKFLTAEQVKKSLDGEAYVFMMFASLKEGSEKGIGDLPVVQEFPEVFSDNITDLPQRGKLSLQLIWYRERVLFRLHRIGCLHQSWVN